jgi:hypothetical protein
LGLEDLEFGFESNFGPRVVAVDKQGLAGQQYNIDQIEPQPSGSQSPYQRPIGVDSEAAAVQDARNEAVS